MLASRLIPTRSTWIWMGILLAYVLVESVYHWQLLHLASHPQLTERMMRVMEWMGRGLAAVGIALFLTRIWRKDWLFFVVLTSLLYLLLSILIHEVVRHLDDDTKMAGYYAAIYRQTYLAGAQRDPSLDALPRDLTREVALSHVALRLQDSRGVIARFETAFRASIEHKIQQNVARRDELWEIYDQIMQGTDQAWRRREAWASRKGKPALTRDAYIAELLQREDDPQVVMLRRLREVVVFDGFRRLGVAPIMGRDIPLFMDRNGFDQFFDRHAARLHALIAPRKSEIRANPLADRFTASVLVTPISLCLSLLGIVLNLFNGLGAVLAVLTMRGVRPESGAAMQGAVWRHRAIMGVLAVLTLAYVLTRPTPFPADHEFARLEQLARTRLPIAGTLWSLGIRLERPLFGWMVRDR